METTATATNVRIHASAAETPPSQTPPAQTDTTVLGLVRDLATETRTFVRQQLELAQTELLENAKRLGRNATTLGIGGFVAGAGSIVLLVSLGFLVAWAIHLAGIEPLLAGFLGLLAVGAGVLSVGGVLILKGRKKLSQQPLISQRTLQTLHELNTGQPGVEPQSVSSSAPCSGEMQARVEATQDRMGETLDELGRRLSPEHINARIKQRIQSHPYRSSFIALGAGLLSGLLLRRRFRHA